MFNLAAIGLIGALLVGATSLIYYITFKTNRMDAEMRSGFVAGVAVPRRFRLETLYNAWLPISLVTCAFAALMALTFRGLANALELDDLKFLSNACAFYFAGISGLYLLTGAVGFVNAISGRARRAIYRASS